MGNKKQHGKLLHAKAPQTVEHLQKLDRVVELVAQGFGQHSIAKDMGLSQPYVCQLWKEAQELAKDRIAESAHAVLAKEFQQLVVLRKKLWRAWERSTEDRERREVETREEGEKGAKTRSKLIREGQAGDAAIAGRLIDVHVRICKLKGLEVERFEGTTEFRVAGHSVSETDALMMQRLGKLMAERKALEAEGSGGNGEAQP